MTDKYDVFISYNSEDRDSVIELAKLLGDRGLHVWLDIWELRPGQPWVRAIERAITSCQSAIVAVGRSGMGPWQDVEMRSALMLIVKDNHPVIPVLLPEAPDRVELPIFLSGMTWVDLREGFAAPGIDRLLWGVTGHKPAGPVSPVGPVSQGKEPVRLEEVFCTSGLPSYTYIEPSIYQRVARDLRQTGKHVLISGPSGSGKTCLVFRILDEMRMQRDREFIYISALDDNADSKVRAALSDAIGNAHSRLVIIDDFHLLLRETRNALGKGLKQLADETFTRRHVSKFVLVGISTSAEGLLFNMTDLGPRLGVYRMPLAEDGDLSRLLRRGEERLAIELLNRDSLVRESNGSYYICQYLAQEVCLDNLVYQTADSLTQLTFQASEVRGHLLEELGARFRPYIMAFVKTSGKTNGERLPFIAVLSLAAAIPKALIPLDELLNCARQYKNAIQLIKPRIPEVIASCVDAGKFSKYLFFEEDSELFSIEDPIFRYFLNFLDPDSLLEALGVSDENRPNLVQIAQEVRNEYGKTQASISTSGLRDVVFVSYSHHDRKWLEQLQSHLSPLLRNREVALWADTRIEPGQQWREEIRKAIRRAKVAVLLVSAHFLASDFIAEQELPPLLRAAEGEGLRVLWVPVSACLYEVTDIAKYQAASAPNRPLDSLTASVRNKHLAEIARKIKRAFDDADSEPD